MPDVQLSVEILAHHVLHLIDKPGELLLGSAMVAELSTMPVSMGGDADEARLVELNRQGDGVSGVNGSEMYAVMSLASWYDSIPFHFRILVFPLQR